LLFFVFCFLFFVFVGSQFREKTLFVVFVLVFLFFLFFHQSQNNEFCLVIGNNPSVKSVLSQLPLTHLNHKVLFLRSVTGGALEKAFKFIAELCLKGGQGRQRILCQKVFLLSQLYPYIANTTAYTYYLANKYITICKEASTLELLINEYSHNYQIYLILDIYLYSLKCYQSGNFSFMRWKAIFCQSWYFFSDGDIIISKIVLLKRFYLPARHLDKQGRKRAYPSSLRVREGSDRLSPPSRTTITDTSSSLGILGERAMQKSTCKPKKTRIHGYPVHKRMGKALKGQWWNSYSTWTGHECQKCVTNQTEGRANEAADRLTNGSTKLLLKSRVRNLKQIDWSYLYIIQAWCRRIKSFSHLLKITCWRW